MPDSPEHPDATDALSRRSELAAQAGRLREFLTDADARGEEVPTEARELLGTLDELLTALDQLAATIAQPPASNDEAEPRQ